MSKLYRIGMVTFGRAPDSDGNTEAALTFIDEMFLRLNGNDVLQCVMHRISHQASLLLKPVINKYGVKCIVITSVCRCGYWAMWRYELLQGDIVVFPAVSYWRQRSNIKDSSMSKRACGGGSRSINKEWKWKCDVLMTCLNCETVASMSVITCGYDRLP